MKDLKCVRGRALVQRWIEEGEHQTQDFKYKISDARKIARSISAFANRDGGRLLIGVKDNGTIAGVGSEEDIYMIETAAGIYCKPSPPVTFTGYKIGDGVVVVCAEIAAVEAKQVLAQDDDGKWRAYYRVDDENIVAPALMVRAWKRRASMSGVVLSLSDAETAIIDALASGPVTVDELRRRCCMSQLRLEHLVVNLVAIGLVDFRYDGSAFRLQLHEE